MADCCLIKKVATVEVYENKNEVRAYGFMAGDRNTPVMEVRFKHLWGESNLSSCKLRWIIVDDVGSLLVGEVPIQSDNTALINLPNELFTGDRRMKVQLTVASCDGERILNLQQFTDLKVINSLAPNEVVEPVYQILINAIYDESQKYLKELETSYTQKYGSLDSLYKSARASLEQYLITAENGGNAEFLQGYSPAHFQKVENTINDLIASTKYNVGDVVEVLGYYSAGDGAGHPRQKKPVGYNGTDAVIGADGSIWGISVNENKLEYYGCKKYTESLYKNKDYIGSMLFLPLLNPRLYNRIDIVRNKTGYTCEFLKSNFIDTNPETVFISSNATHTGSGTTVNTAITLNRFIYNLNNNIYTTSNIKVFIMDDVLKVSGNTINLTLNKRISIESISSTGRSLLTNGLFLYEMTKSDTIQTGFKFTHTRANVGMVYDYSALDKYGNPRPYRRASDLGDYNNSQGVFYIHPSQNDAIYIKPFLEYDYSKISKKILVTFQDTPKLTFNIAGNGVLFLESLDFAIHSNDSYDGCVNFAGDNVVSLFVMNNCAGVGGNSDTFSFTGIYTCLNINSSGAYAGKDIFNYHTTDKDSLAVEVNCVGYGAGKYKVPIGNKTTGSNNATTAHDGMSVYRFNSLGFDCEGGVLADVGDCTSINYDCRMYKSTTPDGHKTSYLFSGNNATPYSTAVMVNCDGGDKDNDYTIYVNRSVKLIVDNLTGDLEVDKLQFIPSNTEVF